MKKHPELKKTEIGRIPKEWSLVRLGNICNQRKEIIQPSGKGHLKFIGLEHVESGKTKATSFDMDLNVKSSKFKFYADDILYGKLRPYLDKAVIVGFEGISSTDLIVLNSERSKVLTNFLIYIVHDKKFINHAVSNTSGTNHPRTSWAAIAKYNFGLPPLSEQKRIAEVLSTVDEAIEKNDNALDRTEKLKRGLMQQLLTRGIGHKEFKDTEIGSVPKKWNTVKLEEVLTLCQYGLSLKIGDQGKYPILKMDDITNGYVLPKKAGFVDLDEDIFEKFKLEKGDILFNRTNSFELVGRTGIFQLQGDYVFASYLIRLKTNRNLIEPLFLMFYFTHSADRIRQLATRAVHQANINATNLQKTIIPLPPIAEQQKISQILSSVDNRLELLREKKGKLERVKRGLMNGLLTGKRRVRI